MFSVQGAKIGETLLAHIASPYSPESCRHLIADHLAWFKESMEEGKLKTVEDLMRSKGEKVRRGVLNAEGVVEYAPE